MTLCFYKSKSVGTRRHPKTQLSFPFEIFPANYNTMNNRTNLLSEPFLSRKEIKINTIAVKYKKIRQEIPSALKKMSRRQQPSPRLNLPAPSLNSMQK